MKEIKEGQIWRKEGPYDWLRIERIIAPGYPNYDGGLAGVVVKHLPPQLKGIKLKGGKTGFYASNKNHTWVEMIQMNRTLLTHENHLSWNKGV